MRRGFLVVLLVSCERRRSGLAADEGIGTWRAENCEGLPGQKEAAGIGWYADVPYEAIGRVDAGRLPLDGCTHPGLRKATVVLWFDGEGRQRGSKTAVLRKPLALVRADYAIVSTNYRFRPRLSVAEQADDVASAVANELGGPGGAITNTLLSFLKWVTSR